MTGQHFERKSIPDNHSVARIMACLLAMVLSAAAAPACAQDIVIGSADAAIPSPSSPATKRYNFAIQSQPLEDALNAFTAITGIQVFYSSALTQKRRSQGVSGLMTAGNALLQILENSNLAPLATSSDAMTLVPYSQYVPPISNVLRNETSSRSPGLTLETLHVQAPVGRGLSLYTASLTLAIQLALTNAEATRYKRYDTAINVWISPAGAVQHSQIYQSTGDRRLDAAITRVVLGMGNVEIPPINLPQPLHVLVSTKAP